MRYILLFIAVSSVALAQPHTADSLSRTTSNRPFLLFELTDSLNGVPRAPFALSVAQLTAIDRAQGARDSLGIAVAARDTASIANKQAWTATTKAGAAADTAHLGNTNAQTALTKVASAMRTDSVYLTFTTSATDATLDAARIKDSLTLRMPYTVQSGTATLGTGDSVQVTVTGILLSDMVQVSYSGNAKFATATSQTIIGSTVFTANKLTIWGVATKKVTYRVWR